MKTVCVATSTLNNVVEFVVLCIVFVVILFLAYFAARLAGGFQANVHAKSNIKIIETTRISNNKYLQIVKIGDSFYLIGVGKDEIHYLTEIDKEDLNFTEPPTLEIGNFKDILSNLKKNSDKKGK
ncbi:MAG: flagellar biosynthetic protein FliO [Lachnospiraceae bacterium]|nr:flagellar biosynthetic protein FliO [Lachnospiraceae bacterium]